MIMNIDYENDIDFMSDDEFEQMANEIIDSLGEIVMADHAVPSIVNFQRYKQIVFAHKALEKLLVNEDVVINCDLHEPFHSVGVISIIGDSFTFYNTKMFTKICGLASNIDVYTRVDDKVAMDLTFHGLTKKIQ